MRWHGGFFIKQDRGVSPGQWQIVHDRGRLHARNSLEPLDQLAIKRHLPRLAVILAARPWLCGVADGHAHSQHVVRVEAVVHLLQSDQAADHQTEPTSKRKAKAACEAIWMENRRVEPLESPRPPGNTACKSVFDARTSGAILQM